MAFRISPLWWPSIGTVSPLLIPLLTLKNLKFKKNHKKAEMLNYQRIENAVKIDIPTLEYLEVTVLNEWEAKEGFLNDPGISYLFKTDKGSLLYDVGFGPERQTLEYNASKLSINFDNIDSLVISHLHLDHMGGVKASMYNEIRVPEKMGKPNGQPCFLPEQADAEGFTKEIVTKPMILPNGMATTGPIARSLFFLGWTEEQSLIARIKDKGLVVFAGCSHPGLELIINMVERLSGEPIFAIGGGFHFPITTGRGFFAGIQAQTILGTGKPPWQKITKQDLDSTIKFINKKDIKEAYISAHDSCDYSISRFKNELYAKTSILKAGATYHF